MWGVIRLNISICNVCLLFVIYLNEVFVVFDNYICNFIMWIILIRKKSLEIYLELIIIILGEVICRDFNSSIRMGLGDFLNL